MLKLVPNTFFGGRKAAIDSLKFLVDEIKSDLEVCEYSLEEEKETLMGLGLKLEVIDLALKSFSIVHEKKPTKKQVR